MADPGLPIDTSKFRRLALSRWDNEGGALERVRPGLHADVHDLTNAELVQTANSSDRSG
jgi:hypothetical protein